MDRISPVFDVATHLLLVDIENSAEVCRSEKLIHETGFVGRASHLSDLRVQILICGAISRPLQLILEAKGIRVIGQICGAVEEIIQAFLKGSLKNQLHLMPGCRKGVQEASLESRLRTIKGRLREAHMRVAITARGPDLTSQVEPVFDRARFLIIINTETEGFMTLDNRLSSETSQGSGPEMVTAIMREGVDAVLTGKVGSKPLEELKAARIEVYHGAFGTVKDALKELVSGQLQCNSNAAAFESERRKTLKTAEEVKSANSDTSAKLVQ